MNNLSCSVCLQRVLHVLHVLHAIQEIFQTELQVYDAMYAAQNLDIILSAHAVMRILSEESLIQLLNALYKLFIH